MLSTVADVKRAFGALFIVMLLSSCDKGKQDEKNTPAFYISESEKQSIPAGIDFPSSSTGYTRVATFYADGVQKYKSQLKAGSTTEYQWAFVAPSATLYDASNKMVGTHSVGPTWQLTGAADSLYGQAFNPPKTAVSPDPNSIDWLLLMPKTGKTPTGLFANVLYIQRIATTGGKAPATPPTAEGQTADIPYTAVYRFTRSN